MTLHDTSMKAIPEVLARKVVLPGDPRYGQVSSTYTTRNFPAVVVLARKTRDIQAALRLAQDLGLEIAVRSGGHSLAGTSSNNGGLVIDLSAMNSVTVLDRSKRQVRIRVLLRIGMLVAAVGLATYGRLPAEGNYVADVLPGMLLTAIGAGRTFTPVFVIATTGVSAEKSGLASGIINTSQQLGSALGLAVLSTLAAGKTADILATKEAYSSPAVQSSALAEGFQRAFLIGAVILAVGAVVALVGLAGTKDRHTPPPPTGQEAAPSATAGGAGV